MATRTSKSTSRKQAEEFAPPPNVDLPEASAASRPNSILKAAFVDPEQRHAMIAEAAYYRAERRRFAPGCELEDWCAAELDIDRMLSRAEGSSTFTVDPVI